MASLTSGSPARGACALHSAVAAHALAIRALTRRVLGPRWWPRGTSSTRSSPRPAWHCSQRGAVAVVAASWRYSTKMLW